MDVTKDLAAVRVAVPCGWISLELQELNRYDTPATVEVTHFCTAKEACSVSVGEKEHVTGSVFQEIQNMESGFAQDVPRFRIMKLTFRPKTYSVMSDVEDTANRTWRT